MNNTFKLGGFYRTDASFHTIAEVISRTAKTATVVWYTNWLPKSKPQRVNIRLVQIGESDTTEVAGTFPSFTASDFIY